MYYYVDVVTCDERENELSVSPNEEQGSNDLLTSPGWMDWVCLTTTHVLQDIFAVLHE